MRKTRLEGLRDLLKIAWLTRGRAKIKCSDSQGTSKRGHTTLIHSFIHSLNEYLLSTDVMAL